MRYPSNAIIKAIFVPANTGGEGKPWHEDVFLMDSYNFMTPVDENQTRYYWFQMRNFAPDDEEARTLNAWIEGNPDVKGIPAVDDIVGLLTNVLADGRITEPERTELAAALKDFSG